MRVSNEDWSRYIRQLSAVNRKAAEVMQSWMDEHPNADGEDLVATAYAVSEHYGDAAGSLACSMYDALAEAQGAAVPPAEPAPNATYDETAKAVYGTLKNKQNTVPATVGRLVKQTGADTMLQNAQRDRAQFAWIPMGDTCAFCLTLGSRGWQNQSKKAMKNGHAEHIHANCDCQYAVRFDGRSTVEGYDPEALRAQYDSFEGKPQEKINAWRREKYAANPEKYREQKRIAYVARRERELRKLADPLYDVFGPISKSHPDELKRIIQIARENGVELIDGSGRMAYAPGLRPGLPGQLHLNENDSIGAWIHEEQHMMDDLQAGWLGFAGLFDVDRRVRMEYNAYIKEIELARSADRQDIHVFSDDGSQLPNVLNAVPAELETAGPGVRRIQFVIKIRDRNVISIQNVLKRVLRQLCGGSPFPQFRLLFKAKARDKAIGALVDIRRYCMV